MLRISIGEEDKLNGVLRNKVTVNTAIGQIKEKVKEEIMEAVIDAAKEKLEEDF